MPDSREYDVRYLDDLALPYDRQTKELSDDPRIVDGENLYVTLGGKLSIAPGLTQADDAANTNRIDRVVLYETLENPPKSYIVASVYDSVGASWQPRYLCLDDVAPAWTNLPTTQTRVSWNSTRPHEFLVVKGLLFIKSFPSSAETDKYGTIMFDGSKPTLPVTSVSKEADAKFTCSSWHRLSVSDVIIISGATGDWAALNGTQNVKSWVDGYSFTIETDTSGYAGSFDGAVVADVRAYPWGVPGPTVPARITAPGGWAASVNPVTVNFGWKYVYCWKSVTGQLTNRSPLESDPSQQPSDTGAFTNKKPTVTLQGNAYQATYPIISIFRSTDGGGTFYFLEDVPNTGGGAISWSDVHRVPGTVDDPKTDMQLDTSNVAPSLVSNCPPPPCNAQKITGTDPVEPSTNLEYFAGRIWYGIGNRLYFSSREECLNGVPEESFNAPNGIRGNYYVVKGQLRLLKATKSALYVITDTEIHVVTGRDVTDLGINLLVPHRGAAAGMTRAIAAWNEIVFYLTSDLQIAAISGATVTPISTPLGTQFRDLIVTNTDVQMEVFKRDGNEWLIVAAINRTTPANTKVFVFDLLRKFWFTPWVKPVSALVFGRIKQSDTKEYLVAPTWNGTDDALTVLDLSTRTNNGTAYSIALTTNLFTVPSGNHINSLRRPAHHPVLSYLLTERTKFGGDTAPTIVYRLDEFSGATESVATANPPFIAQRTTYNINWYPIQKACQRVQLILTKAALNEAFELQNIGFVFQSEAGA